MPRVLLTGANGQLGYLLEEQLLKNLFEVVSCTHESLDITNEIRVTSAIEQANIDLVINCAAFTNVDLAESQTVVAYNVNALGAKYLAKASARVNIPIIHISTDYVFGKPTGSAHHEDEPKYTECVYAKTKSDGESFVKNANSRHIIIRASWIFGPHGKNFVKTIFNAMVQKDELGVVNDQLGNPTPARALAEAIARISKIILQKDFNDYGIYHYAGAEPCSWYDFACNIYNQACNYKLLNKKVTIKPLRSDQYPQKAKRPEDSRLDTSKIQRTFNLTMPSWSDYIYECISS